MVKKMDKHLTSCCRYGREDEELMGLRFCNEVVIAAEQIYPTQLEVACGSATKPLVNDQVNNQVQLCRTQSYKSFSAKNYTGFCYAQIFLRKFQVINFGVGNPA